MKKLTILLFTALSSLMLAQTVPNECFSTWSGGAGNSPISWLTTNAIASGSASESFTVHGGCPTSAALNTVVVGSANYGGSIISLGTNTIYFKYAGGSNPIAIDGWYELTTSGGDQLVVTVLTKSASSVNGGATATYSTGTGVWKKFSACITAIGAVDSVSIALALTNKRGHDTTQTGSMATVDSVYFGTCATAGVEPISNNVTLEPAYPNPANNICSIVFSLPCAATVNVALYDLNGRKVINALDNTTLTDGTYKVPVDVSKLANGIYEYTVTADGVPYTQKLVVAK